MAGGTIILLNGVSSSGKTTIARELRSQMKSYYFYTGWDHFLSMLPEDYVGINQEESSLAHQGIHVKLKSGVLEEIAYGPVGIRLVREMHQFIASVAKRGSNLIVDDLVPEVFLKNYLRILTDSRVYFIGIKCPLEELEKREKSRRNRFTGTARLELDWIHKPGNYDLELDTSKLNVSESAKRIVALTATKKPPQTFKKLRSQFKPPCFLPDRIKFRALKDGVD